MRKVSGGISFGSYFSMLLSKRLFKSAVRIVWVKTKGIDIGLGKVDIAPVIIHLN